MAFGRAVNLFTLTAALQFRISSLLEDYAVVIPEPLFYMLKRAPIGSTKVIML
jgi:hypothetical protein